MLMACCGVSILAFILLVLMILHMDVAGDRLFCPIRKKGYIQAEGSSFFWYKRNMIDAGPIGFF